MDPEKGYICASKIHFMLKHFFKHNDLPTVTPATNLLCYFVLFYSKVYSCMKYLWNAQQVSDFAWSDHYIQKVMYIFDSYIHVITNILGKKWKKIDGSCEPIWSPNVCCPSVSMYVKLFYLSVFFLKQPWPILLNLV